MKCSYPNLELIEYKFISKIEELYPGTYKAYYYDIRANVFPQTWSSTALGFDGFGGSALTMSYTTVMSAYLSQRSSTTTNTIVSKPEFWAVYFGDRLAYLIEGEPTELFFTDLENRNMASVQKSSRYYEE